MPRAEVGSTKYLNNKLKSKGLQRLRWYCQACERQMRDENGFKCHTQTEGHVRQMLLIGEDARKHISDYSSQFQRDFLLLLKTSHGEKKINVNHFYQEYISNKEHVHMNATRWPSLTEFAKFLGREGICRIEEGDKGLEVAWIDNSPEALRRQDAIRKKERQDRGDEEREQRLIRDQIKKAKETAKEKGDSGGDEELDAPVTSLWKQDGERIKLSLGKRSNGDKMVSPPVAAKSSLSLSMPTATPVLTTQNVSAHMGACNKPKNVFAMGSKKNSYSGVKPVTTFKPQKPMSEAERIMKEEIERERLRERNGFFGLNKRQKLA